MNLLIILTGLFFGLGAVLLVKLGNPGNYGFCAVCQLRDVAGALGLHQAKMLQYARPEIIGWVLGAFAFVMATGNFRPRGGSNPAARFVLGMAMMIGALVFSGCPLRAILRLAAGDLNGITGLVGFILGIAVGIFILRQGFNLGKAGLHKGSIKYFGYLPAIIAVVLLIGVSFKAGFLNFSVKGPGSMHAPVIASLAVGLATGALAWRTRMCLSGGVRDFILVRDTYLLKIYGVMFLAALLGNMYFGFFKLGFTGQPLAHSMHLWNFLGLFLTGIAATLAGGCPLRQLIMAGEGNTDAMFCILGMVAGANIGHALNIAATPAGVAANGQMAVIAGLIIVCGIGLFFREKSPNISRGV